MPQSPTWLANAVCVIDAPLTPSPTVGSPNRIMNAVIEHTNSVSKYTPKVCTNPCFTGCDTVATAAAFGADPSPASLENRPRRIPFMNAIPMVAPAISFTPSAWVIIVSNISGTLLRLISTTNRPTTRYNTAMNGTKYWVTLAMRCTPPKIISAVIITKNTPTINLNRNVSLPTEVANDSAMEFA